MKPLAVFALGLGPGLLIAAVPGPRLPGRLSSPDEHRALVACLEAHAAPARPDPAALLAAQRAAETLGTALLDAERCTDDQCAGYLPPQIQARRSEALVAVEKMRESARRKAIPMTTKPKKSAPAGSPTPLP